MPFQKTRKQRGILNEYLGLIFFILFVLGLFAPLMIELLAYSQQNQDVDRITKIAAQRACTLGLDPLGCVASDAKQCAFSVGIDVLPMQRMAFQTFINEAVHPEEYGCDVNADGEENPCDNFPVNGEVQFLIYDALGNPLNISSAANFPFDIPGSTLATQYRLFGANVNHSLCPSFDQQTSWNYCQDPGGDANTSATLRALSDSSQRLKTFQPSRCNAFNTSPCRNAFRNLIDRCVVCAQKRRESIFRESIFGQVLSCSGANSPSFIPCKIRTCSSVKFNASSLKRDYNLAYQGKVDNQGIPIPSPYLLDRYAAEEMNPVGFYNPGVNNSAGRNEPSTPPANLFESMNSVF